MNRTNNNRPSRRTIFLLSIGILMLGGMSWLLVVAHKQEPVEIKIASTQYQNITKTVSSGGKVTPVDDFQARANFPGIVEKIYVEVGNKIRPGQVLIKMKDPFASSRVATATSALRAAQAGDQNINQGGSRDERIGIAGDLTHAQFVQADAERSLAALRQLQARGAASMAEISAAEQRLLAANATVHTLTERSTDRFSEGDKVSSAARVADMAVSLDAAKVAFANANIAAPEAGTVYSVLVSPYDFVPMGAELLHVADLNKVEVRVFFDEPDIGQLIVGQPVKIVWDARPDKVWHGHIRRAPLAAMTLGTRSVAEGIIAVDDAKGDLLPNTNVNVTVTLQQHTNVLTIPRAALFFDGPAGFVYRIVDGRLKKAPVAIGIVNLDRAEITGGLTQVDKVATGTTDGRLMTNNLPVKLAE